jgi:transcriptional regulator with XRE-family HTH domain
LALRDRINEALSRKGVNQAALAQHLGVSAATVSGWCSGTKRPSPTNMEKIGAFLAVSPGYLSFGEGAGPPPGADLTDRRAHYKSDLTWYWRPGPRDRGRELGNAATHAFEVDIPTLGRESGQNTSDEKVETEPTVELRYTIAELTGKHLSDFLEAVAFETVRPHLEAAAITNLKAGAVIRHGLDQLDGGHLLLIRIEDYGANGLTGPEFERDRYMAVVRNTLDSQKGGSAGGSFGLGWATLPASSQFGLVLCNSTLSVAEKGLARDRFVGVIDLPWHTLGDKEYAGRGWFGVEDPDDTDPAPRRTISYWGNEALVRDTCLFREDARPGTSFLIVGAYDASDAVREIGEFAEKFTESVADNFWPAMVERPDGPARLQVIVRAERNGTQVLENYIDPVRHQPSRVGAFQKHLRDEISESLEGPGDVVRRRITLHVPRRTVDPVHEPQEHEAILLVTEVGDDDEHRTEAAPNTVAYMRGSQMVIQQSRLGTLPMGARTFQAIVLAGEAAGDSASDRAADRFLRASEPPAHNRWTGTPEITSSYVRGGKAAIEALDSEVKRVIREIIRQPSHDLSDGPDALKELIRIAPPPPAGKRPQIKSVAAYGVTDEGAWEINDATVTLPPRSDGRGWTIIPVLRFGTESGSSIAVQWEEISAGLRCELDPRGRLVTPSDARTATFSARTDPTSHPVGATRAAIVVDIRTQADEAVP